MVKKLFKHEIKAYARVIVPMHLLLIGIALMCRFVQLFEAETDAYMIVFNSSVVALCIGAIVCSILTIVFGVRRFYQNMFSSEGYLTLTLPVTTNQHLFVKTAVAALSQIASLVMILIAGCCASLGDVCIEVIKVVVYYIKHLFAQCGVHAGLFIGEFILTIIFSLVSSYMVFYACIALGQRAKKNRIGVSVGVFFIYYMMVQAISTMFTIVITVFYEQLHLEQLIEYLLKHQIFAYHMLFITDFILSAIIITIGYSITKRTIDRKLNLE